MKTDRSRAIPKFPIRFLYIAVILTGLVLVWLGGNTFASYRLSRRIQEKHLAIQELRGTIIHLDEVLTMSAYMAAATGDRSWEERYQHFEPQLDAAIKQAMALAPDVYNSKAAADTDAANRNLVEMEQRAFGLVRQNRLEEARKVLFSDAYRANKQIYSGGMKTLAGLLQQSTRAMLESEQYKTFFNTVIAFSAVPLLLGCWLMVLRSVYGWRLTLTESNRLLDEHARELSELNTTLDQKVAQRAQQLEETHKRLLETSRQAGMAEVATAVLHNVGNVLNSVNVSASLVTDTIRESKLPGLTKAVGLMNEQADLGQFLSSDPKGRQLPDYLRRLGKHLSSEQALMLNELGSLSKNIEHIKDIVSMQQAYARVSGVTESVSPADLVEDALRMNAGALARHDVQVVREYGDLPKVLVEKHKVLQVLVNLISNAKYAMADGKPPNKQLTMRIGMNGNNHFKIAVTDNGIGIPAENLTRIFAHGFTTKKTGHGFGLHSGALAAREMGGALLVHSDGPGKGATFTLELPLKLEEGNE